MYLKNENFVINIDVDSIESMVYIRNKIQKMFEGEIVDIEQILIFCYVFI